MSKVAEGMLADPESGPSAFIDGLLDIMLKVLVIPPSQQKSADALIRVFCQVYTVLLEKTQKYFR